MAAGAFGEWPPATVVAITAAMTVAEPVMTAAMITVRWLRSVLPAGSPVVRVSPESDTWILQPVMCGTQLIRILSAVLRRPPVFLSRRGAAAAVH